MSYIHKSQIVYTGIHKYTTETNNYKRNSHLYIEVVQSNILYRSSKTSICDIYRDGAGSSAKSGRGGGGVNSETFSKNIFSGTTAFYKVVH